MGGRQEKYSLTCLRTAPLETGLSEVPVVVVVVAAAAAVGGAPSVFVPVR